MSWYVNENQERRLSALDGSTEVCPFFVYCISSEEYGLVNSGRRETAGG